MNTGPAAALLATAFMLGALPSAADTQVPQGKAMEEIRLCRAAAVTERSIRKQETDPVFTSIADTMLDQLAFSTARSIAAAPPASVEAARQHVAHIEALMLGFAATVRANRDDLRDTAARRGILMRCIEPVWLIMRAHLDTALREPAVPAPPAPRPQTAEQD